jgi:pyruvate/2-oxoglutarate dehydrogenase complex dihydrolipoamide acyltransferase (E2) component
MCDHLPEIGGWTMSSAGQILVVVPDLGDSVTEATLTHWLATVGTIVEPGEAIAEVEAEKVNIEIPVDTRVRINRHLVAEGDRVNIGAAIAEVTLVD